MAAKKDLHIIRLFFILCLLALFVGCGGGGSGSDGGSKASAGNAETEDGDDTESTINETLNATITISNISITNLENLKITSKTVDKGSTLASAVASDVFVESLDEAEKTTLGSVEDVSNRGKASASASLDYDQQADSIFMGSSYTLSSEVSLHGYGYTQALSSISEMIYFTAVTACDVTIRFDYSGADNGLNPGVDAMNYSYASINCQIANFNAALSQGLAANVEDMNHISPGTVSITLHFDAGESGWITLGASADNALFAPNPNL